MIRLTSDFAQFSIKALRRTLTLALLTSFSSLNSETLQSSNPFLPPGYGEKKPEAPKPDVQTNGPLARELEFRGIVQYDGKRQFSVFNKGEKKAYWIKENEMHSGIKVSGYDAKSKSITVVKNGRIEKLSLMSVTEAPVPVASSVTMPKSNNGKQTKISGIKPNNTQNTNKNTVPRRRVILPKK